MAMSRQQLRRQAIIARYHAGKDKPLERRRVQSFLSPIASAFNKMMSGMIEVDAATDLPITRLSHNDEWQEVHKCINGFVVMIERLLPDIDVAPLRWVSSDLQKQKLMAPAKVLRAKRIMQTIEERMTRCTWRQVIDAVRDTEIEIQLELAGIKEAA